MHMMMMITMMLMMMMTSDDCLHFSPRCPLTDQGRWWAIAPQHSECLTQIQKHRSTQNYTNTKTEKYTNTQVHKLQRNRPGEGVSYSTFKGSNCTVVQHQNSAQWTVMHCIGALSSFSQCLCHVSIALLWSAILHSTVYTWEYHQKTNDHIWFSKSVVQNLLLQWTL